MPRKAKGRSDAGNAAQQGGAGQPNGKTATKTEAVLAALRRGMSSPTEIAGFVKSEYGLDISPAHVSNIKSKSGFGRKRRKGGRRPKAAAAAEPAEHRAPARGAGVTANELDMLLQMAKRMGGVRELRNYLDILGRFQG